MKGTRTARSALVPFAQRPVLPRGQRLRLGFGPAEPRIKFRLSPESHWESLASLSDLPHRAVVRFKMCFGKEKMLS